MKTKNNMFIDVMLKGRFACQLRYSGRPFPLLLNGKVQAAYDFTDIRQFVEEKRPSIKDKDFRIAISNQQVK